jgi:hypothetical protein
VFFDKEYHVEGSRFLRFAWFRRKQQLHFVHHRHANTNFAVIDFFWDRLLGTYRAPEPDASQQAAHSRTRPKAAEAGVVLARALPKVQAAGGFGRSFSLDSIYPRSPLNVLPYARRCRALWDHVFLK